MADPPPLRSNDFIKGLPGLSGKNLEKVQVSNVVTDFAWFCVQRLRNRGIPGTVENPLTSMLWKHPICLQLQRHPECQFVRIDFCGYGTKRRKPTYFFSWHFSLLDGASRMCTGRDGVCSFSQQPHWILSGTNDQGVFLTKIAQPYPISMCRVIRISIVQQLQCNRVQRHGQVARAIMM